MEKVNLNRIGFYVRWIIATLIGIVTVIVGGAFGFFASLPVFLLGTAFGASIGALVLGFAQKYVLQHYIAEVGGWVLATSSGILFGCAVFGIGLYASDTIYRFIAICLPFIACFAFSLLGMAQAYTLRSKTSNARVWLVPHALAGLLFGGVFSFGPLGVIALVVYIVGTAFVMDRMLLKNKYY